MPTEHIAPIEFEAKVLGIDPEATERLILDKGGQKLAERFMHRYVYDITPGDQSKWIRLRDTGSEITLTVKQITSDAIDGTHEIEVVLFRASSVRTCPRAPRAAS